LTEHSAHDRQDLETDDDVDLVLLLFVIDIRIESFAAVFPLALAVSTASPPAGLITASLEIELLTMLARRMILLLADSAHFDDDDDDVLDS
jgi:hypothetical protein